MLLLVMAPVFTKAIRPLGLRHGWPRGFSGKVSGLRGFRIFLGEGFELSVGEVSGLRGTGKAFGLSGGRFRACVGRVSGFGGGCFRAFF